MSPGCWLRPSFPSGATRDRCANHSRLAAAHQGRNVSSGPGLPGLGDTTMGKILVAKNVTLDGVMQGPGRPDEDTRDGFELRGWGIPYSDETTVAKMGERMGEDRAFLFGRRTYDQLLTSWNAQGGPFKEALNTTRKYVAT